MRMSFPAGPELDHLAGESLDEHRSPMSSVDFAARPIAAACSTSCEASGNGHEVALDAGVGHGDWPAARDLLPEPRHAAGGARCKARTTTNSVALAPCISLVGHFREPLGSPMTLAGFTALSVETSTNLRCRRARGACDDYTVDRTLFPPPRSSSTPPSTGQRGRQRHA
jgi:hypothetical protein